MNETISSLDKPNAKESIKDFLLITITSLVVVFLVRFYIAQPFIVSGASMEPAFHTGDYLIIDQISYELDEPQRGDVVVFKYPLVPSKFFIKRIIGLPGETVKVEGLDVHVRTGDDQEFEKLNQDFIEFSKMSDIEITLGDNEYFVMGDNRAESLDSRTWGPLDGELIIGKALIRLFPINKIDISPGKIK
jgi:signal peptidase I